MNVFMMMSPELQGRYCNSVLRVESSSCQQRTLLLNKFLQEAVFWHLLWLFSLMVYRVLDNLLHSQKSLFCGRVKTSETLENELQLNYLPGPGKRVLFVMPVFSQ